jgi:hypothetical protein
MSFRWRKSKAKEDSVRIAQKLEEQIQLRPYSGSQVSVLVRAAVRSGEVVLKQFGNRFFVTGVEDWIQQRVLQNTVTLDKDDYLRALFRGLRMTILSKATTADYLRTRRRDFGQRWTDWTRGALGEIAIQRYMDSRWNKCVKLEERTTSPNVKEFLPTDITEVIENEKWRKAKKTVSIKTSKLGALWLDIPGAQVQHSDAFTFAKVGLTINHLATFLKDFGFLDRLFELAKQLGELDPKSSEGNQIKEEIPSFKDIPAYINGFVLKEDFDTDQFDTKKRKRKGETVHEVLMGIGKYPPDKDKTYEVAGIGKISGQHFMASCGNLKWKKEEWKEVVESL